MTEMLWVASNRKFKVPETLRIVEAGGMGVDLFNSSVTSVVEVLFVFPLGRALFLLG